MSLTQKMCRNATLALSLALASIAQQQLNAQIEIVALTSESAPDSNGVYASSFGVPVINDSDQIAFISAFSGTSGGTNNNIAYVSGKPNALEILARKGDPLPTGDGTYTFTLDFFKSPIGLDSAGNVNALAVISGSSDNAGFGLVHFYDGNSIEIVRDKQTQSITDGNFFEFDSGNVLGFYYPIASGDGELYFLGEIDGPDIFNTTIVSRWTRDSGLEYIIGSNDPVVENTTFNLLGQLRPLSHDKVAITTSYLIDGTFVADRGIAEWSATDGHTTHIRNNDVTPDGISNFSGLGPMVILDTKSDGSILTSSFVQSTTGFPQGLFSSNGSVVTEVATSGKTIAGEILRNGITGKYGKSGDIWFTAQTEGRGTHTLFRKTPQETEVALQEGFLIPGTTNSTLENIGEIYPNQQGDLLFSGTTRTEGVAGTGYYMRLNNGGTLPVVEIGQPLAGSTISGISLGKPFGTGEWPTAAPINNNATVCFQFTLANGNAGIAVWTPPQLPALSIRLDENNSILSFIGEEGSSYRINRITDPAEWTNDWPYIGDIIIGTGDRYEFTDTDALDFSELFYKLSIAQ